MYVEKRKGIPENKPEGNKNLIGRYMILNSDWFFLSIINSLSVNIKEVVKRKCTYESRYIGVRVVMHHCTIYVLLGHFCVCEIYVEAR